MLTSHILAGITSTCVFGCYTLALSASVSVCISVCLLSDRWLSGSVKWTWKMAIKFNIVPSNADLWHSELNIRFSLRHWFTNTHTHLNTDVCKKWRDTINCWHINRRAHTSSHMRDTQRTYTLTNWCTMNTKAQNPTHTHTHTRLFGFHISLGLRSLSTIPRSPSCSTEPVGNWLFNDFCISTHFPSWLFAFSSLIWEVTLRERERGRERDKGVDK